VSAKLTDEGSRGGFNRDQRLQIAASSVLNPSSDAFGATFSRKGRREVCGHTAPFECLMELSFG